MAGTSPAITVQVTEHPNEVADRNQWPTISCSKEKSLISSSDDFNSELYDRARAESQDAPRSSALHNLDRF